jgi:hypothetical protein
MEDASAQPGPCHQDVIATPQRVLEHLVKRRSLISAGYIMRTTTTDLVLDLQRRWNTPTREFLHR